MLSWEAPEEQESPKQGWEQGLSWPGRRRGHREGSKAGTARAGREEQGALCSRAPERNLSQDFGIFGSLDSGIWGRAWSIPA